MLASLLLMLRTSLSTRATLQLEILALCHQLHVVERGYFDDETCRLELIDNPFGPKIVTYVFGMNVIHVSGNDRASWLLRLDSNPTPLRFGGRPATLRLTAGQRK